MRPEGGPGETLSVASYKTRPKAPKPSTSEDSALHASRGRTRRSVETTGSERAEGGPGKPSSPHIRPDLRHLSPRRLKTRRFLLPHIRPDLRHLNPRRLKTRSLMRPEGGPGVTPRRERPETRRFMRPAESGPGETLRREAPEEASHRRLI